MTTIPIFLLGTAEVLIALYVALWLSLAIHELGHAVAGWFTGMEIIEIRLGSGTEIIALPFGRLTVRIATYPSQGWVLAFPTRAKFYRARWFLFALSGPLASALTFGFLDVISPVEARFLEWSWSWSWVSCALQHTVRFVSLGVIFLTLWPRRCRLYGQEVLSDGFQLLQACFLGRADGVRLFAYGQANRARLVWAEGRRNKAVALLREAEAALGEEPDLRFCAIKASIIAEHGGQVDEALMMLRELLAKAESDWNLYGEIANVFGLIVICENLAAEFPEAEQIIRKAIAACPDQITLSGTLGGILVEQGRHEEAAPLLKALNYVSPEPHEQAITAAYLAHTSLRSGDPEAARSYADKAMSVCPGHRLVKRLVRSL